MKTKTWFVCFFKWSLNFRVYALQSELSKVSISNFVAFQLQSMSSKIERPFEKTNIIFHQKSTSIRQLKRPYIIVKFLTWWKSHFFCCKNVLLCIINTLPVVLEIIINKFSYCLKIMSINTFPKPQPDSASYHYS